MACQGLYHHKSITTVKMPSAGSSWPRFFLSFFFSPSNTLRAREAAGRGRLWYRELGAGVGVFAGLWPKAQRVGGGVPKGKGKNKM